MSKGRDPYQPTCDYKEEAQQFGESFECTESLNHSGSHYDAYLKQWARR